MLPESRTERTSSSLLEPLVRRRVESTQLTLVCFRLASFFAFVSLKVAKPKPSRYWGEYGWDY